MVTTIRRLTYLFWSNHINVLYYVYTTSVKRLTDNELDQLITTKYSIIYDNYVINVLRRNRARVYVYLICHIGRGKCNESHRRKPRLLPSFTLRQCRGRLLQKILGVVNK
jgi:hypothetical protein